MSDNHILHIKRNVSLLFSGKFVSELGNGVFYIALSWFVLSRPNGVNEYLGFLSDVTYIAPCNYDTKNGTRYGGLYRKLAFRWKPIDALTMYLGVITFDALIKKNGHSSCDRSNGIGRYHDESSLFFKMEYSWASR